MSVQSDGAMTTAISRRSPRVAHPPKYNGYNGRALNAADVRAIAERALAAAQDKRATDRIRRELESIDRSCRFSTDALSLFQDLLARLGVATFRPIKLPLNDQSFWHRTPHTLANYQTTTSLPKVADVVVIGAGLTGAAAAYHLKNTGMQIAVLDQGDPAGEASGRNGGNFELLPENSVGIYEGLAPGRLAFMRRRYPRVPIEVLQAVSERQASLVLGLALRNRDILKETILNEGISCDFSPKGWLHIASNEKEEQAVCDEVSLAAQHGQRIEIWSRSKISEQFGINAGFLGRFIPGDGTYHPFKYVCGELHSALRAGVALYTRTKVRRIISAGADKHRVVTDRGTIVARRVIVATNAFTRNVLPELSAIAPYQSQILVTEHVPDRVRGRIVTSDNGPVFFNQPRESARDGRAPLLMGGGDDRPMKNPSSRRRSPAVHARLLALRDSFYRLGSATDGGMGRPHGVHAGRAPLYRLSAPRIDHCGRLQRIWWQLYDRGRARGSRDCRNRCRPRLAAGRDIFAATVADRRSAIPHRAEGPVASRRVALPSAENCESQISETMTLQRAAPGLPPSPTAQVLGPSGQSQPANGIKPETLQAFNSFKKFSLAEIRRLLRHMRRWNLEKNTIVLTEGSPGGTCFAVVEGAIDVSINARGQQQLLATLNAGSIFGQMSLIENEPRTATCSVRTDAVLLEFEREPCERLLRSGSATALKLLATLNEGLISALRGADHRLMQLDRQNFVVG